MMTPSPALLPAPDAAITLDEVLKWHAATRAGSTYLTFLADGERVGTELTFAALDARVREVAALISAHADIGDRALLLYPPGPEFVVAFLACLAAGVIAVPAYPPRNPRHMPRIESILRDAGARLVLTVADTRQRIETWLAQASAADVHVVCTDAPSSPPKWDPPLLSGDSIAFLQYTSGSTGQPKGVMVTHANLLANERMIRGQFGHDDRSDVVSWLPMYHDMGLVGNLLQPLYLGSRVVLMSPAAFLQKPVRWLQAVSTYRARTTGAPNFAYDLTTRTVTEEQKAGLDLSSLSLLYNGSEPIDAGALDRFAAAFASCGLRRAALYPCYGMAETTLIASGGRPQQGPHILAVDAAELTRGRVRPSPASAIDESRMLVGCGYPVTGQETAIVDPDTMRPASPEQVGEIWLRGPHVARGYWRNPDLTRETFEARTADGNGPFLRTGDLGFVTEGELYVTGRIKDLIIIRGRNYYPQDIERAVSASHPALASGGAAAFGVTENGAELLVIVQELQRAAPRDVDREDITSAILRSVIDEFELQPSAIVLVKPLSVPKTSSGKVQRRACCRQWQGGELDILAEWRAPAAVAVGPGVSPRAEQQEPVVTTVSPAPGSRAGIAAWLRQAIAIQLGQPGTSIDPHAPFSGYGLDSVIAIRLTGELAQRLGRDMSPALLYDYPTIDRLARHLAGEPAPERTDPVAIPGHEPIAIVGMGCRLPGGVRGVDAFWRLLEDGIDAITTVPSDRWDIEALFDPAPATPGRMSTRYGGFLDGIDRFDPQFFGISPREAAAMDPQQRILLEVAWEALEQAGIPADSLSGTATGVFVGISTHDYARLQLLSRPERVDMYSGIGNAFSAATGRLSYLLGAHGPSIAVDTACSSSLVAVHLACQSLRAGESTMALAGGVNVILAPELTVAFSKAGMMAPDGRCKTFDARADGYVRSEGCGVVVLKRLTDAVADGDRVIAILRGSAVNQDGRSNGLTAPNGPAQEQVIRRALRDAGVVPSGIDYVEAHGTGTPLGDPIEVRALAAALGEARTSPVILGSVKTNLGHLEAAAGVVSLIKTALAIDRGIIPASLHFTSPNPYIPWASLPVTVSSERVRWPIHDRPRRAGVSSFGFTGTNAHVVLEQHVPVAAANPRGAPAPRPVDLLTVSAKDAGTARTLCGTYASTIERLNDVPLADICHTANAGRSRFDWRVAVVASAHRDMAAGLASAIPRVVDPSSPPRVAWLFTGQGAQHAGMGRGLYESQPVFRDALDSCDAVVRAHRGESLLSVIFAEPESAAAAAIHQTTWTQPAIFSIGYALAELWRSWGITPSIVMGHSVGEFTAAVVAGVFPAEIGLRLVLERGRLMQSLPAGGGMLAVFAGEATARHAADAELLVGVAATNAPDETVLSGDAEALDRVAARLARDGVGSRRLHVSHAFHSVLVAPVREAFAGLVREASMSAPSLPIISNLTGSIAGHEIATSGYWTEHLTAQVRFAESVRTLIASGPTHAIELGPSPVLSALAARCGELSQPTWLPSLRARREEVRVMLDAAAALYMAGAPLDWKGLDHGHARRRVTLPTYPFASERCWVAPDSGPLTTAATGAHAVLGARLPDVATTGGAVVWQLDAAQRRGPVWNGYVVDGVATPSAAVYPHLALAAAREVLADGDLRIARLDLFDIHTVAASALDSVQVVIAPFGDAAADCRVFARMEGSTWTPVAEARVERRPRSRTGARPPLDFGVMVFNGSEQRGGRHHYQLVIEAARFADRHGLSSVWAPERHYTAFGGLYPNPSVLHAALARETRQIRLMAGSMVVPLHNPLRAAEDWALVDNLSNGRVGVSLASGWNPDDFAMVPERYLQRGEEVFRQLAILRRLWRGERMDAVSGDGRAIRIRTHPTPIQKEFPACITAAGNPRTFERAGESGGHLLTHLLDQGVEELSPKIALYRAARARAGYDPDTGRVSVMLHTFLGEHAATVREQARAPYCEYIKQNIGLLKGLAYSRGSDIDLAALSPRDLDEFVGFLYERFAVARALLGSPESAADLARRLYDIGVDEIACLIDFGPPTADVLRSLPHIARLKDALRNATVTTADAGPLASLQRLEVAAIEERCAERLPAGRFYRRLAVRGVSFGPGLQVIERFVRRDGEAMAILAAPCGDQALALDVALQTCLAALPSAAFESTASGMYVPWDATEVTFPEGMVGTAYVLAVLDPDGLHPAGDHGDDDGRPDPREFTATITLAAPDGHVVARIERLRIRRVAPARVPAAPRSGPLDDSFYRLQWQAHPLSGSIPPPAPGRWLILADADADGTGSRLARALGRAGCQVTLVRAAQRTATGDPPADAGSGDEEVIAAADAEAMDALVARSVAAGDVAGVVQLWPLDAGASDATSAASVELGQIAGVAATVLLVQALVRHAPRSRLWVITRGAQGIDETNAPAVAQAPAWGLGRIIAIENPDIWGGLVDLDPASPADDVPLILNEIGRPDAEDQIAYRAGQRFAPRLVRTEPVPPSTPSFDAEATYLITGGVGALGRRVAHWMVRHGAVHLVLTALHALPAEEEWEKAAAGLESRVRERIAGVQSLRAQGADVTVLRADGSDASDMDAVFLEVARLGRPLRGIVHLAGMPENQPILDVRFERDRPVLAPKVAGAWLLHERSLHHPLDFFIAFSSIAAVWGSRGQPLYAAANHFLDALALYRRAHGLPSLTICWGPWAEGGMVDRANLDLLARLGVASIDPDDGTRALGDLLASGAGDRVVARVDWRVFRDLFEVRRRRPLLEAIEPRDGADAPVAAGPTDFSRGLDGLTHDERRAHLIDEVQRQLAAVLGWTGASAPDIRKGFFEMGMDSLTALELRNRLQATTGVTFGGTVLFNYSTISALADYLLTRMGPSSSEGASAVTRDAAPLLDDAEAGPDLSTLSEDELARLLDEQLGAVDSASE